MNQQNNFGLFNKYLKTISRYDKNFLDIFYKTIDQTEGWLWPEQAYLLYAISSHLNGKLVEIGSWKGKSASVFCIATQKEDVDIYCVDTWEGSLEHKDIDTSNLLNEFKQNLSKINSLDRINIQRGPSVEVAKMHPNESCDLIFIDAAHDYDNVKADILAWYPKLKNKGIMIGHDYPNNPSEIFQDLKLAVDQEVRDKKELFKDFGSFSGLWGAIKI
jgi:predicted O-methyltransferase YrrM